MNRYLFICAGVLLLLCGAITDAVAQASPRVRSERIVPTEAEIRKTLSFGSEIWGGLTYTPQISRHFYQAVSQFTQGDTDTAAKSFAKVRTELSDGSYLNAPDLSFELLQLATQANERGQAAAVKELINHALLLSPSHPRIHIAVASFVEVVGIRTALQHLGATVRLLPQYPLLAATLLLNLIVVTAISISLALLFVSVVQLLRSGEYLVKQLGKLFPRGVAGLAGTLLLPIFLVGPLFLGLLATLAVWSMLLSLYRPHCRYYAFAAGAIILLWSWLVPNARILGIQVQLPQMAALEDINVGNYNPSGTELLLSLADGDNPDSTALFGAAIVAQRRGEYQLARDLYAELNSGMYLTTSLQEAVMLNTVVLLYEQQRFREALLVADRLENQGVATFELFHNRSLIHMGLLETEKYRNYYELARASNEQRLDLLMGSAVNGVAEALPARLSLEDMWTFVRNNANANAADEAVATKLAQALLKGGTPGLMELLAAVTMVVGVFGLMGSVNHQRRRRVSTTFVSSFSTNQSSAMWCVLPAGYAIAGRYPVAGACYLGVVIASVLLAFGAPMHSFQVVPLDVSVSTPFLAFAVSLLVLSTGWSLYLHTRSPLLEE